MDINDFRQQLVDEYKNTYVKQDEIQEDIVRLSPKQAQKKFDEVIELIEKTHEQYNLDLNIKKRKELDKKIAEIFKKFPDILTIQDENGYNLGMIAAQYKLEQSVLVALDNMEASLQQNYRGYNIGMTAAEYCLEQAVLKALDNQQASLQQNHFGYNIGMIAAQKKMEQATLKALENKKASEQQGGWNNDNIGMIAVDSGLEQAALKSMENKEACKQKNRYGETIESLYQEKFGKAFAH